MSQPAVRAAIVGFGHAGAEIHYPVMRRAGIEPVVAVATSPRARARADEKGLNTVMSVRELEAHSPDVVVIAVPDALHEEFALQAIEVAPPLLVIDKPLATSAAGAARVIDAAKDVGCTVVPFQNRRWDGDFLTLRSLVARGELGYVFRVESRITRWAPEPGDKWRDESFGKIDGQLGGNGSHLVDQMLVLLGPVDSVYGEVRAIRSRSGPNDDVFIALRHRSGASSHMLMSALAAAPSPRFTAYGTRGTYTVDGFDPQQDRLRAGVSPVAEPTQTGRISSDHTLDITTERGDWSDFYVGVREAVHGRAAVPVRAEDALTTLTLLESARESSRIGAWVEVT